MMQRSNACFEGAYSFRWLRNARRPRGAADLRSGILQTIGLMDAGNQLSMLIVRDMVLEYADSTQTDRNIIAIETYTILT